MRLFKRGGAAVLDPGTEPEDDAADDAVESGPSPDQDAHRSRRWRIAFRIMPALIALLAVVVAVLRWQAVSLSEATEAGALKAASDGAIAILSYQPSTVEQELSAAQDLLTGSFRGEYAKLTRDVVIPGAKQKQVSAVTTVPAAAPVSVNANHAVVLVFVNQTIIVGNGAPNSSNSSVRVKLDRVGDRWLISAFDPI